MIIDAYNHIYPKKYQDAVDKKVTGRNSALPSATWAKTVPTLVDLEARFRIMDAFDGYMQVITMAPPPLSVELAKIANDELADLVFHYPDLKIVTHHAGGISILKSMPSSTSTASSTIPRSTAIAPPSRAPGRLWAWIRCSSALMPPSTTNWDGVSSGRRSSRWSGWA